VRSAQAPPALYTEYNECEEASRGYLDSNFDSGPTAEQTYDNAVPSWFIGLAIHLGLGVGALIWAWRRTRTPARHLPNGSRIA
jgi:hypothetical protein